MRQLIKNRNMLYMLLNIGYTEFSLNNKKIVISNSVYNYVEDDISYYRKNIRLQDIGTSLYDAIEEGRPILYLDISSHDKIELINKGVIFE